MSLAQYKTQRFADFQKIENTEKKREKNACEWQETACGTRLFELLSGFSNWFSVVSFNEMKSNFLCVKNGKIIHHNE